MIKYRHELKLGINPFDKALLSSRLSHILKRDDHTGSKGYYVVRSIYFEDLNNTALKEKLMGVNHREKFRLRTYDGSTGVIKLERKVKNNQVGFKESAGLSREECLSLLAGDYRFLKERAEMVCRRLYCKINTGLVKPKTIVQYHREAFVWHPGRVRITIDSNVQTGLNSVDFLNFTVPLVGVAEKDQAILEIKYDDFLPAHIGKLLQLESRQRGSFSKYVLCRRFG